MSKILVVDASPLDRQMIGGLLGKHGYDDVFYADDGAAAIRLVEEVNPDLVLTDLIKSEMGGLELVSELKQNSPLTPVILMTSEDTQNTALKALKEGAASYVSKKRLSQDLAETIAGVLGASREQRAKAHAMMRLNRWEADFTVESDMNLIMTVSAFLMQNFAAMDLCDAGEQVRVGVALAEALQNAYFHGSLQLPKDLKETSREDYARLAESRAKESPYKDRKIQISARFSRGHAIFSIRDEGNGFDVSRTTNPFETPSYARSTFFWSGFNDTQLAGALDPSPLDHSHGRGLMLMRTLMDEVKFNEQGNQVTLIKKATKTVPTFAKPATVAAPAPVVSKPAPIVTKAEPPIRKPAPVAPAYEPVETDPEQVISTSPPVATKPEAIVAKAEPVSVKPELIVAKSEPVAVMPEPLKPLQLASKPVVQLASKPLQITARPVIKKPVVENSETEAQASAESQEMTQREQETSEPTLALAEESTTPQNPEAPTPEQPVLSIKSRRVMAH